MEVELITRAILSLIFVVGLMFGCLALYKKFFMGKNIFKSLGKMPQRRMNIAEVLYIDRFNKLVIIKKDEQEITLLINQHSSFKL